MLPNTGTYQCGPVLSLEIQELGCVSLPRQREPFQDLPLPVVVSVCVVAKHSSDICVSRARELTAVVRRPAEAGWEWKSAEEVSARGSASQ
jgi:hypothetical protein